MNWIKEHTFAVSLGAITLVVAVVLWILGSSASNRYDAAKKEFDASLSEAARFETLEPYPTAENLESKESAVEQYRKEVADLRIEFKAYTPEKLESISVQAFSDAVKRATDESRAAFGEDVVVPPGYYSGFEVYRNNLPAGNATSLLNYQLKAIHSMMLKLAESGVSSLINVHRPRLPEEDGKEAKLEQGQIARSMPIEVVFEGRESAVRAFLNTLVNDKEYYLVLRSLRIRNKKLLPPRTSDAKFDRPVNAPGGAAAGGNAGTDFNALFGGAQNPVPIEGGETEAAPVPAPAVAPPPSSIDSSRILQQVLGEEELQVFARVDLILFLETEQ